MLQVLTAAQSSGCGPGRPVVADVGDDSGSRQVFRYYPRCRASEGAFHLSGRLGAVVGLVVAAGILLGALVVSTGDPEPITLQMLAGSELDDVVGLPPDTGDPEFLSEMRRATGVTLEVRFTGSLSGAETMTARTAPYDLAWFASDSYLQVLAGAESAVVQQQPIVRSPVVLGVKQSVAERYQWRNRPVSWRDVAAKVAERDPTTGRGFTFAMTDPAASNSGLAALVEAAIAMTDARAQLSGDEIEKAVTPLKALFGGVGLTAGSSGWLTDQYVKEQSNLDGLVNYESEILALNQQGAVEQLQVIHPSDGVVTANYPLMLLPHGARHQAAYERLFTWLRGRWAQQWLAEHTRRHKLSEAVGTDRQVGVPSNKNQLDQLLLSYQDKIRKPPRTFYVVDTSGSMREPANIGITKKLDKLKEVFAELAGDDRATAARFSRFRTRERVTILPFSGPVAGQFDHAGHFRPIRAAIDETISEGGAGAGARHLLVEFVNGLEARGATALFDALYETYYRLDSELGTGALEDYTADWYPSVVLLTDGERHGGIDRARFQALWQKLRSREVRVFAIHFGPQPVVAGCGKPGQSELCKIATLTGGRVFDTSVADLLDIVREIRGYQ
jgi:Ca-activated chloride channel homolog